MVSAGSYSDFSAAPSGAFAGMPVSTSRTPRHDHHGHDWPTAHLPLAFLPAARVSHPRRIPITAACGW